MPRTPSPWEAPKGFRIAKSRREPGEPIYVHNVVARLDEAEDAGFLYVKSLDNAIEATAQLRDQEIIGSERFVVFNTMHLGLQNVRSEVFEDLTSIVEAFKNRLLEVK